MSLGAAHSIWRLHSCTDTCVRCTDIRSSGEASSRAAPSGAQAPGSGRGLQPVAASMAGFNPVKSYENAHFIHSPCTPADDRLGATPCSFCSSLPGAHLRCLLRHCYMACISLCIMRCTKHCFACLHVPVSQSAASWPRHGVCCFLVSWIRIPPRLFFLSSSLHSRHFCQWVSQAGREPCRQ